jgi:hypothetical protein
MKKLQKLVLHKATIMTNPQMKQISGGRRASCSASCGPDCDPVEITGCVGECSSEDGVGVSCVGPTTSLEKPCCGTGY